MPGAQELGDRPRLGDGAARVERGRGVGDFAETAQAVVEKPIRQRPQERTGDDGIAIDARVRDRKRS